MTSHPNTLPTLALSLILGMFLAGCNTSPQPQNSNMSAQSNLNSNSAPTGPHGTPPEGWMDAVNGTAKAGGSIAIGGWAADAEDGAPVKKVEVLLDNNVVAEGTLGTERADVVKVSGRQDWLRAGWAATISLATVSPGHHRLSALAYDSAGNKSTLNGSRDIEVAAK
jgi:hypothetical protein